MIVIFSLGKVGIQWWSTSAEQVPLVTESQARTWALGFRLLISQISVPTLECHYTETRKSDYNVIFNSQNNIDLNFAFAAV